MTALDVWNAALALLPHDRRVASADEESVEAMRCREHWDAARRHVLGAREWGWLVRETPPCASSICFGPGGGVVERPADALRVLGLYDRAGNRIGADAVDGGLRPRSPYVAALRYLPDSENPDEWPAVARDAVVAELAARICPVLTDNERRSAELRSIAADRLSEAGRQDAQETATDGDDPLAFVHARR